MQEFKPKIEGIVIAMGQALKAEQAMKELQNALSNMSIRFAEVQENFKKVTIDSCTPVKDYMDQMEKKQLPEEDFGGKTYARKQAIFWANKPSHKIKRRL